jgi:hypothetical protein
MCTIMTLCAENIRFATQENVLERCRDGIIEYSTTGRVSTESRKNLFPTSESQQLNVSSYTINALYMLHLNFGLIL